MPPPTGPAWGDFDMVIGRVIWVPLSKFFKGSAFFSLFSFPPCCGFVFVLLFDNCLAFIIEREGEVLVPKKEDAKEGRTIVIFVSVGCSPLQPVKVYSQSASGSAFVVVLVCPPTLLQVRRYSNLYNNDNKAVLLDYSSSGSAQQSQGG